VSNVPIRRIGVSTGGGDCPGLNAVLRAVVKSAVLERGWEVLGIADGFDGLLRDGNVIHLDDAAVSGILHRGGTILGTTNRGNPFSYSTTVNGEIRAIDRSDEVVARIRDLGIDVLVLIGGDGTLSIGRDLVEKGVRIVGVPKTIDNDLEATDLTFGFDTAVGTATEALDRLHTTAESHHRVMVLEVMGRNCGWIALCAGIAGGADVILIPEIPFTGGSICRKIRNRQLRGKKFSLVVVAEGACFRGGEPVYSGLGGGKAKRLGGIGQRIAEDIAERMEIETRVTVLGHIQRGGSPTAFDRVLATRLGCAAVRAVADGRHGHMVALRGEKIVTVPLAEALRGRKSVPARGELVRAARSLGVSFGDEEG
jgi:6-phosphofructokinase 1